MKTRFMKVVAFSLAVLLLFGAVAIPTSAASNTEDSYQEILASLTAASYADYLSGAKNDGATKGSEEISLDIFGLIDTDPEKTDADYEVITEKVVNLKNPDNPEETEEKLLLLPDVGMLSWTFNISEEQAGLYGIRIEYVALGGSTASIERKLFIDGVVPFDEARALSMTKVWEYQYVEKDENGNDTFKTDAGNNDLRADISAYPVLRTYECADIDGFYNEPFQFHFKEGVRSLSLVASKEPIAIKSITLFPVEESKTLADYKSEWNGIPNASADKVVTLRAETPSFVSDKAVYPSSDRSSAITTPIDAFSQKINVIGASGYSTTGQWASYSFTVEEDGIYNIVARFKQSALQGMFASRVIKLASSDGYYGFADGTPKAPYEECYFARFDYSDDWCCEAINTGEEGSELMFYFKKGVTYTLQMEVGLGNLSGLLNTIESSLTTINNAYLEIMKLTGASPDEYRDYGFSRVMPLTIEDLGKQGKVLEEQANLLREICGTSGSNIATLENISRLLLRMYQDEDEIAPNLSNLKSYIGTLGTWINSAKAQPITVDYYAIASADAKLPKANANFFQAFWHELKSFVASFFVDYDAMGVSEKTDSTATISVWLAYGRDQSQIWKNLITNKFSNEQKIAVDLKLVAGGTLLPSVLAKRGPDSYIGLDAASVINYAIRGAVVEIQDYEGFDDVVGYNYTEQELVTDSNGYQTYVTKYYWKDASGNKVLVPTDEINFNDATMVPITLYDKTYGLPEQANFPMMFYRRDILADLEIDVPKTWDDVLAAIPTLQANNMQIGLGHVFASNMFLYQYGGNLWKYTDVPEDLSPEMAEAYKEYAGAAIGLDTNVALDSFQFCCRLYTDYSFPTAFDAANRFRTGEIPIMVADYCTTYNQLVVFATEIRGLWQFTTIPGVLDANGVINNDTIVTVTATIMLNGCRDIASTWKYMQWQAGAEVQADYGNEMVALVGPAAKYATANLQGVSMISWSAAEQNSLREQFDHQAAIPNYPGSYIIARYTNFAFFAAYNEGEDPVVAIQDYINIINQELTRKRQEFEQKTLKTGQTPEEAILEEAAK
ncbi:MAG: extracellular solute-binding protein [Ruminococcaceae bacterium]|nr:extracellular solute-binding protein [Oscillospiraceae bacterium]